MDTALWAKFKRLTPFEGLWDKGVNIGSFGNASILQLKPQVINYLDAIYDFWSAFPVGSTDVKTVRYLNLRCPRVKQDRDLLIRWYDQGMLFSRCDDRVRAQKVLLQSKSVMIATLASLCNNMLFFDFRGSVLPYLVEKRSRKRGTPLADTLEWVYTGAKFDAAYRKIWRVLLSMPKIPTKEEPCGQNWYRVVRIAHEVGIQTPIIQDLIAHDPDEIATREFLRTQCMLKGIEYSEVDESVLTTITSLVRDLTAPKIQPQLALYSDMNVAVTERCGSTLPGPQDIALTLPPPGMGITRLYASIATFNTFFGSSNYEDPEDEDPEDEDMEDQEEQEQARQEELARQQAGGAEAAARREEARQEEDLAREEQEDLAREQEDLARQQEDLAREEQARQEAQASGKQAPRLSPLNIVSIYIYMFPQILADVVYSLATEYKRSRHQRHRRRRRQWVWMSHIPRMPRAMRQCWIGGLSRTTRMHLRHHYVPLREAEREREGEREERERRGRQEIMCSRAQGLRGQWVRMPRCRM